MPSAHPRKADWLDLRGRLTVFDHFHETVNTTARIETTGARNKIHLSEETSQCVKDAGKGHWLRPREEAVVAKGKGELATFWLEIKGDAAKSTQSGSSDGYSQDNSGSDQLVGTSREKDTNEVEFKGLSNKLTRLVNWNCELLIRLLKTIVSRRKAAGSRPDPGNILDMLEQALNAKGNPVLDEVREVITLPQYNAEVASRAEDPDSIDLGEVVSKQLHDYIMTIATLYRDNDFHNFEHVSHVCMSVVKLLSRIVAPDSDGADEKTLHDHTYGITSDPMTQFGCVFSAIIHDVDHQGVPNAQLVKEKQSVAKVYCNKSVAEQNSVQLAWELLMHEDYRELRRTIYTTANEFYHFRRLVVNSVMATDIMDKDLGAARKARWNKAFSDEKLDETEITKVNRKATIVIEHLIQASDVSHTMQHWHIYRVSSPSQLSIDLPEYLKAHLRCYARLLLPEMERTLVRRDVKSLLLGKSRTESS